MTDSNNQPANKKARSVQQAVCELETVDLDQNQSRLPCNDATVEKCEKVKFCVCRLEEIQSPNKKLPPESTPQVMFTGFEPTQVQQYTKVKSDFSKPYYLNKIVANHKMES